MVPKYVKSGERSTRRAKLGGSKEETKSDDCEGSEAEDLSDGTEQKSVKTYKRGNI